MSKASSPDPELLARLDRVEQKLDMVLALLRAGGAPAGGGTSPFGQAGPSGQPSASVLQHIRAGQLIHAIKEYRMATGLGLKEAKDAVEGFRDAMKAGAYGGMGGGEQDNY